MTASMILDALVIVLLVLVGGYGVILNRRLSVLRSGQEEMQKALASFDEATRRAEMTLKGIESAGLEKSAAIQSSTKRAQKVLDELAVMTSSGERIAERIEDTVRDVRTLGGAARDQRGRAA